MADRQGGVLTAAVWMFLLSILLFWLPILGPLVAGYVGGKKADSLGSAILAAILPALIVGGILFFSASLLTAMPLFGFLAGAGGFALMAVHVVPLILGAVISKVI